MDRPVMLYARSRYGCPVMPHTKQARAQRQQQTQHAWVGGMPPPSSPITLTQRMQRYYVMQAWYVLTRPLVPRIKRRYPSFFCF